MVHNRGIPNHNEVVHYMKGNGESLKPNAICNTGAWHIRFTYCKVEVTCERCKEKLGIK